VSTVEGSSTATGAQPARDPRAARIVDRDVASLWHDRFARMLFRDLPQQSGSFVLDVHCGAGRTTAELLLRLDDASRIFALEPDPALVALAKTKVRSEWKNRVYFKQGSVDELATMADGIYDLTVANLLLAELSNWEHALAELMRVTKPGGQVLATTVMRGSWDEVEDLLDEVLAVGRLEDGRRRLERLRHMRPTGSGLAEGLRALKLKDTDFVIEQEKFSLLFPSGRELLFSPIVEFGPLLLWKAILGRHAKPQEVFWQLKEAVDTYYLGHVFSVSVMAGLVRIRVPGRASESRQSGSFPTTSFAARYWQRYPTLDALWRTAEPVDEELELDIDIEETERETSPSSTDTAAAPFSAEDAAIFKSLDRTQPARQADDEIEHLLDEVFEYGGSRSEADAAKSGLHSASTPEFRPPPLLPPPPMTGSHARIPPERKK